MLFMTDRLTCNIVSSNTDSAACSGRNALPNGQLMRSDLQLPVLHTAFFIILVQWMG